jgi:hypothetical protein
MKAVGAKINSSSSGNLLKASRDHWREDGERKLTENIA